MTYKVLRVTFHIVALCLPSVAAEDCNLGLFDEVTDDFFFAASSDQGAAGDIVAVDLSLTIEAERQGFYGAAVIGCYDSNLAELVVDQPLYDPALDRLTISQFFFPDVAGSQLTGGERAFAMSLNFESSRAEEFFEVTKTLPVGTLFFRLKGTPGEASAIRFCDDEFVLGAHRRCARSKLLYAPSSSDQLHAASTRHVDGIVRIIEGEPSRTDIPDVPPNAKIYPEAPTPGNAEIHFELSSAVVQPGSAEVPLELYITSNYEFSGFSAAVSYPSRYLNFVRLEEYTRPGGFRHHQRPHESFLELTMMNSRRRLGREGERVHVATYYFDVTEEASEVSAILCAVEDGPFVTNWIGIHHTGGQATEVAVVSEVTPWVVTNSEFQLQLSGTTLGDVNLDYSLDISDPIMLLGDLFQGHQAVVCWAAADFNQDGRVLISDPIAILQHLFGGRATPLEENVFCDG